MSLRSKATKLDHIYMIGFLNWKPAQTTRICKQHRKELMAVVMGSSFYTLEVDDP